MGLTNTTSFTRVQQMQYYPSGLPWNDNYQASQQPYKYGGKEFVEMHGLDEYDDSATYNREIWNDYGLVRSEKYDDAPEFMVSTDGLIPGVYFMRIYRNGEFLETQKLIVK